MAKEITAEQTEKILLSYGRPYMLQQTLAEYFGITVTTVRQRLGEIDSLIGDRYPETAIIRDGNLVLANILAFVDYEVYRQRLLKPQTAKYVPPFDPVEIRRTLGYNMFDEALQPKLYRSA